MKKDNSKSTTHTKGKGEEQEEPQKPQPPRQYRRRAYDSPGGGGSTWLLSFTDVMALMLTFFVLLYALSSPKQEDWENFSDNIQKHFNKYYGQALNRGDQDTVSIQKVDFNKALDLSYLQTLLEKQIKEDDTLKIVTIIPQPEGLLISFPDNLLFEPGKAAISAQGSDAMFVVAQTLSRYKNRVEVIGHADPRPVGEGAEYASNWELSLARAAAVAATLENFGYAKNVIIRGGASGRYQDLPESIPTEKRLSLSRRVDIVIRADAGERAKVLDFQ